MILFIFLDAIVEITFLDQYPQNANAFVYATTHSMGKLIRSCRYTTI